MSKKPNARSAGNHEPRLKSDTSLAEYIEYLDDRYLDKKEASRYSGLSYKTLLGASDLPRYNPTGGKIMFRKLDIDSWMKRHRCGLDIESITNRVLNNLKLKMEG